MDTLIKRHGAIMDQYDPQKKIGMVIDEWGTWFNVEPGTNPGFLYQQNTMRDALVAGINLNIFNKNCDRVKMANIAQMINVLQAVILTDGDKMMLTPTYHVFDMYQCHQGAELLDSVLLDTATIGTEAHPVPNMQESVSLGKDGLLHITMNNLSLTDAYPVSAVLEGVTPKTVTGTILTGAMADHNTFDAPDKVRKQDFTECAVNGSTLDFTMPPCSVLHLAVEV
jgi:alpha-N-arabinofuranosidase